ncbi:hypothetical protein HPB47_023658 [Ixodes persulcatus]|uniref:Uncharacterized protein n=1 Tax=Ixodes persulcatus TaxID=34615 RepID=A0AC60Q8N3_IXOPE|nr:hypothetical protein HPB47_023658 [Ixodes persulcatus]
MSRDQNIPFAFDADHWEDRYRVNDGLRAPYDVDRQRALEPLAAFNRAPPQHLAPQAPNSSAFEHASAKNQAPAVSVNNVACTPWDLPGGDEASKQLVEQDLGRLQRRKFRLRHRKGLKERKARKFQRLLEDDSPRIPSHLVGPNVPGGQRGFEGPAGLGEAANSGMPRSSGEAASRAEVLAGLKVEYARAYIAAEEPDNDSGPMELLCTVGFKEYASITWTVNGRPLENFIDRSSLTTIKNEVPVKVSKITINQLERLPSDNGKFIFECTALVDAQVTKATIALGSIIEDTCTTNGQCEARGASCSEGRCLCKASQPVSLKSKHLTCRAAANLGWPCDYSEQCSFVQPNSVCSDSLVCICSLGFVRSLDGKICDKLTPGNLIGSACKENADCHSVGASCANSVCKCANDTVVQLGYHCKSHDLQQGCRACRKTTAPTMHVGSGGVLKLAGEIGLLQARTLAAAMSLLVRTRPRNFKLAKAMFPSKLHVLALMGHHSGLMAPQSRRLDEKAGFSLVPFKTTQEYTSHMRPSAHSPRPEVRPTRHHRAVT